MLCIIWFNRKKDYYYYRIVKGCYKRYYVGYKNQYGHEIVLIIRLKYDVYVKKTSIKKRVLMRLISFLQNINERF